MSIWSDGRANYRIANWGRRFARGHRRPVVLPLLVLQEEGNEMSRICAVCGKKPLSGRAVARRGMAKRKGGAGSRVLKRTKRKQMPNLQTVRTVVNGRPQKLRVCTKCLKAGKVLRM
jgi:large subunit ribosomal protein L28